MGDVKFEMTQFKRGLMRILIDDENCMERLRNLLENTKLEAFSLETKASRLRSEQRDIEDLMIFLNSQRK